MSQPSQMFGHDQLRSLSFIQLFHLCVALARWNREQSREQSLMVRRAEECDRERLLQPGYAAVLLHESGEGLCGTDGRGSRRTRACDKAG